MNERERKKKGWKWGKWGRWLVRVKEEDNGEDVRTVNNPLLVPAAAIDVLLTAVFCALNYCFRYDPELREKCSMVSWSGVRLQCTSLSSLAYPHYVHETFTSAASFSLPDSVFFSCAIVVPSCLVVLVEIVRARFPRRRVKLVESYGFVFPLYVRRIPRFLCAFLLGGSATGVLVSVMKLGMASPRPHLLAICNYSGVDLSSKCSEDLVWSPNDVCQGDQREMHEALRSFPSYHAALAVYCGVWTWVYFARMARVSGMYGSSFLTVGGVLVMTSIGATHGYLTYQSSSTDIIAGGLIGAVAALYVVYSILNRFKERRWRVRMGTQKGVPDHCNLLPLAPLKGTPPPLQQVLRTCTHAPGPGIPAVEDPASQPGTEQPSLRLQELRH
nr:phospholipid phosphatase-related protein type 5-like isoform X2 [Cherax quadricarinatus]